MFLWWLCRCGNSSVTVKRFGSYSAVAETVQSLLKCFYGDCRYGNSSVIIKTKYVSIMTAVVETVQSPLKYFYGDSAVAETAQFPSTASDFSVKPTQLFYSMVRKQNVKSVNHLHHLSMCFPVVYTGSVLLVFCFSELEFSGFSFM